MILSIITFLIITAVCFTPLILIFYLARKMANRGGFTNKTGVVPSHQIYDND